jgi:hypothetical protein
MVLVRCYIFPWFEEIAEKNIGKVKNIRSFTLPRIDSDQRYFELVQNIRKEYGSSLNEDEQIVTMFLNEDNELERFNSDDGMDIAVQNQMHISNERDPNSIGFVFKVYTGRAVDQQQGKVNLIFILFFFGSILSEIFNKILFFLYNPVVNFNFRDLLNSYHLFGELVFPASESNPTQHSNDDNCLDGLEIENWPNWVEEFENEF